MCGLEHVVEKLYQKHRVTLLALLNALCAILALILGLALSRGL